jgi:uncharacterized protein YjbJ (UPF0337 family)
MTTNYQEGLVSSMEDGPDSSTDAKERAQKVAGSAAEEGQHVAGVAQEHVKKVTGEAKDQLRGLMDEATSQIDEQSRTQKSKLAETLRGFGDDLDRMSSQGSDGAGSGTAQQLVSQAADQARGLAGHLEDKEPQELLEDVRRFARQKPGPFVLGALVAGVVVGRFTRGAKAAKADGPTTSTDVRPTPARVETATPGAVSGLDTTSLPGTVAPVGPTGGPALGGPR